MSIPSFFMSAAFAATLLSGNAAAAADQYSVFPLPLPAGVTLGANDILVPAAISNPGASVLYSLRNTVTGTVAWYRYWAYYDETEAIGTAVAGFQHLELTSINDSFDAAGRAWNADASGAITAEMPVLARSGSALTTFGASSGEMACMDDSGDCYGRAFPGAVDFKTLAGARAAFWIPYIGTTTGYVFTGTALQDRPAIVQRFAPRTVLYPDGGAYGNGDYIAGTCLLANGSTGFWRELRPVGSASVLELVVPPASMGAAYLAGPSVPAAACGLTVTGKATYRAGRDDDASLPTLSFYSDGAVTTLIQPPTGATRNVVRCGGVADVQGGVVAVGMAKHRIGSPASGSDGDAIAWIWSPGDAQASPLQARVPKPATPRLGANANAISIGDQSLGGQILCDGWDPATTTTTSADRRVLLLTPIPSINVTVSRSAIAENATDTPTVVSVIPSATAASRLWKLDIAIALGGTAVKDVDYQVVDDPSTIVAQTATGVVVRNALGQGATGLKIVPIDHGVSGADKTITISVDPAGAGFLPTTAYLAGASPTATVTIVERAAAPAITAQPADATVTIGKTATFTVAATGDAPLTYTWSRNGGPIAGATTATYTTPATTADDNYASYSVAVSNAFGGVASRYASLTVLPVANGTGLAAAYFANQTLAGAPALVRTDAKVDFAWGSGSPGPTIPADHFSARWTGQVQARAAGTYTFTTISDDGVRLWIDGTKLVDNWTNHGATANSGQVFLQAGATCAVIMEYYENTGGATAKLAWAGPGFASETVPTAQLYPLLPSGTGTGLAGAYFANQTLAGTRALARTDATVDFSWGSAAPAAGLPADHFSVRWSGQVTARTTALHTFTTTSDDGVRLWVDGRLLVDNWTNHGTTANSGQILLQAGSSYALTMEYYENTGGATARLSWSAPGLAAEVVPASQLTPTPGALALVPAPARIFASVMPR
jgi:hypothetical protein